MKVLIVTETLLEGGAELFALRLARGLLAKGEQVQVLSLNKQYENKEMTANFIDVPIKRLQIPLLAIFNLADRVLLKLKIDFSFKYFFQGRQIKKIAAYFDVVHSHYIQVDFLIASIKRNTSFKHVVTVHGDYSAQYDKFKKGALHFWLHLDKKLAFLAKSVNQWIVISNEQQNFFDTIMRVPAEKIVKIYNGYMPPFLPSRLTKDAKTFTVGLVSRGNEQKGWKILIEAFLKMPADTKLLLVGGSDYLDTLKAKYGTNKRIVFTGFQQDTFQWMHQMDVFVLPTLYPYESLPTVITEALCCGLPVIATNVGEIETMITDEHTGQKAGFIIDFDGISLNESQLVEKLLFLYQHPTIRKQMQETAVKAFQKFDMNKCANAYLEVYAKL